jgi:hypothetical protein
MPKRLLNQNCLEWQRQRFESYFLMGWRIGADTHHFCRASSEHFSKIGKNLKPGIFSAQLDADPSGRRSARATS